MFIDFDNVEIGVRNTLNTSFDAGLVLDALKERGEVVSKMAYGDWRRSGGYSRMLTQHAIRMVQRNPTPSSDKNGADINLALDALEMAFTHTHINAFVIVGGDSDFISLVEKLKQSDKRIFIVGGRQFTSQILQRDCHEFIAYENLTGAGAPPATAGRGRQPGRRGDRADRVPNQQPYPSSRARSKCCPSARSLTAAGTAEVDAVAVRSTFSERTYRRRVVSRLSREAAEGRRARAVSGSRRMDGRTGERRRATTGGDAVGRSRTRGQPAERPALVSAATTQGRPTAVIGTPADGVRELAQALGSIPSAAGRCISAT